MEGMQNLNQAKKFFKVGQKWKTNWIAFPALKPGLEGATREIVHVTSNGCIFRNPDGKRCWLDFGGAKNFQPTEKGFNLMLDDGRINSSYELVP